MLDDRRFDIIGGDERLKAEEQIAQNYERNRALRGFLDEYEDGKSL